MYPSYLNLEDSEIDKKVKTALKMTEPCRVCPRSCGINRSKKEKGFCNLGTRPMISSFSPHFGEEKCLVGIHGSGTVFFTYCNLRCVYCQNYEISQLGMGREVENDDLAEAMLKLQNFGCHNINLVTPTPQVPQILASLQIAISKGLKLPLVYNTGAYDSLDMIKLLDGIVDIYMPDFKYSDPKIAHEYSSVPKYPEIAKKAIREMYRQVGDLFIEKSGIARRGLLVRHLVLPGGLAGTEKIMEFLAKEVSNNTFVNIMNQYRPHFKAQKLPSLNRSITSQEYFDAREAARKVGLKRIYPFQ